MGDPESGNPICRRIGPLTRIPALSGPLQSQWPAGTNWVDGGVVPEQPAGLYRKGMAHPEAMVLGATTRDGISTYVSAVPSSG